jgi:hypothetical protein
LASQGIQFEAEIEVTPQRIFLSGLSWASLAETQMDAQRRNVMTQLRENSLTMNSLLSAFPAAVARQVIARRIV